MKNQGTVAMPIAGLLGIAFVVLKIMDHIDWPWWLVTVPFWAGFALIAGGATAGAALGFFSHHRFR